jgi:hydroxypyruvate isomerase
MPRFAANITFLFNEHELLDRFDAAAAAGFEAVECLWPYEHPIAALKERLERNKLKLVLVNTARGDPAKGEGGLCAVPGREADFMAQFEQALSFADALGAPVIHALAGHVPETRESVRCYLANLKRAGSKAADHGKIITIEPLNARDMPSYFLQRSERAAEFIGEIGLSNVKLQFDVYHVQISEGDLQRRIERLAPIIGHVQVAAVPSRHEPDEGEVHFPAIFETFDRIGYDGWISAEYRPRGRTEDGLGWLRPYGIVPRRAR